MHTLDIPGKGTFYIPEDLSECDPRQYIEMAALIYEYQSGALLLNSFRVQALYKLLNMEVRNPEVEDLEKMANVYQLSLLLDSFFEPGEDGELVIKQYYIHNPIPSVINGFRTHFGPPDEFNYVKMGEYLAALEAFIDFHDTGDAKYLYQLFAALYRPKAWFRRGPDRRTRFRAYKVESRALDFSHQPTGIIYGVYLYFASFQKWLRTAKITIQGTEIDMSVLYAESGKKAPQSKLPDIGMRSLIYTIAESRVFGTFKEILDEVYFWDFQLKMYDMVKRGLDQEAAFKSLSKK